MVALPAVKPSSEAGILLASTLYIWVDTSYLAA